MSDETKPQDSAAMPPASAGSQPVAWAAINADGKAIAVAIDSLPLLDDHLVGWLAPLYRSPTLTDEEREAIRNVLHHIATKADYLQREDCHLRSLLERL